MLSVVCGNDELKFSLFLKKKITMKFSAACALALVASASAFAPAPSSSVSELFYLIQLMTANYTVRRVEGL
jgi:hypothetical protein